MKNRTQLVIGAALLAGVATLLLLPQSKADKSREEGVGFKVPEQVTAEPEKKTRVPPPEPEVLPEPQALFETVATEEEAAPEQALTETGESEKPTDPILALVDKIEDAAGKVRVLSNLAGSFARAGDAEQAATILTQAGEILDTIEANDELAAATGFFAAGKLHAGETDAAMEMLERTLGLIEKIESAEAKLAAEEQLAATLGEFSDNEQVQKFITDVKARAQKLELQSNPILSLIGNIEGSEGRVRVLCNLAGTLAQAGDTQQATAMLDKAQEIIGLIEDNAELAPSLSYLAVAQIKLGKPDEAKVTLATALSTVDKIKGIDTKVGSFGKLITALNELDDQEQIRTVLTQSLDLASGIQQKAQGVLQQSLTLVSKMQDGEEKATVLQQIASAMSQPGNAKRAEEIFVQALTIATQIADAEKKALALEKIASTFAQTGPGGNFTQLQFSIGWMYFEGQNLPRDHARAASWFRKAAELGHPQAQVNLAMMYMEGNSMPANNAEALKWFTQAAEQGDAEGQTALGMMYALGRGVETDLVQANKWIFIAAEQGDKDAQTALTQIAAKLTPEQLAESKKLAKEWEDKRGAKPSASTSAPETPKTAGK
jgi:tetratricopeptide (TPR) repeat protein